MKLAATVSAGVLAVVMLGGGVSAASALYKDVKLNLDGKTTHVGAFALTVADLLNSQNVRLNPGDIVRPAIDAPIADGQLIDVQFQKEVIVLVDADETIFKTTATTVNSALDELQIPARDAARIIPVGETTLARGSNEVTVVTPKDITLQVSSKKTKLTSTHRTVKELIEAENVPKDADDIVTPDEATPITTGMTVKVTEITKSEETRTEKIPFETEKKKTAELWVSESRTIVTGKAGKAERNYLVTTTDGKETSRELLSEKVLAKPVTAVVEVGTKQSASGKKLNLARAAMWDKIARCESTNRWNLNTGNGYYGGLQFNRQSWNLNGGRDFAALPHQATRAEQITVANRYYAKAGLRPWSCRRVL